MLKLKTFIYGLLGFALVNPSFADLNCIPQPTCESLGYTLSDDCSSNQYIYCPFDTSYKKCIGQFEQGTTELCTQFTLEACPTNAKSCYKCENKNGTKYLIKECKDGYSISADGTTCVEQCVYADKCVDKSTSLSASMPANAQLTYKSCTACGETKQIAYSWECKSGYCPIGDQSGSSTTKCLKKGTTYTPNTSTIQSCRNDCMNNDFYCSECYGQSGNYCSNCEVCMDACETATVNC